MKQLWLTFTMPLKAVVSQDKPTVPTRGMCFALSFKLTTVSFKYPFSMSPENINIHNIILPQIKPSQIHCKYFFSALYFPVSLVATCWPTRKLRHTPPANYPAHHREFKSQFRALMPWSKVETAAKKKNWVYRSDGYLKESCKIQGIHFMFNISVMCHQCLHHCLPPEVKVNMEYMK